MLKMRTGVETTGNNIGIEDIFKSKKPGLNIFKTNSPVFYLCFGIFAVKFFVFALCVIWYCFFYDYFYDVFFFSIFKLGLLSFHTRH